MNDLIVGLIAIMATIAIYLLTRKVHFKLASPFSIPILTSTFTVIVLLLLLHIPYDTYMIGGDFISHLLGPAVVALALPLYQQRETLKQLIVPIIGGVFIGSIIGVATGILLTKWGGFDVGIIYAFSAKSVTTPVAMAITESLGGVEPLAAVFVMVAGVGGTIISPFVFKLFHIKGTVGRGVGLGSASHAIGTADAMDRGRLEGSISTIAMILSAVTVSVITPGLIQIIL